MRFFFHIGFNGFRYRGWQRQSNVGSVQEVIEETLSGILKEPVSIMGCGRTDAQVHASQFFFHMDVKEKWDYDLQFRLNKQLPGDIAVFEIIPVDENDHARFDATQRRYDYFIHTYKDPFLNSISTLYLEPNLNLDKMKQAVALLTQYNDYKAFCKTPDLHRHTICKVTSALLFADKEGDRLRFQISADRFLGRMVRFIVAKLLLIGQNKLSLEEFESYFITRVTPKIFEPAFPQGLFLSKVTYPFLEVPVRTTFSDIGHPEDEWVEV
jgi:tRNA pseudouridine38-40 synthase